MHRVICLLLIKGSQHCMQKQLCYYFAGRHESTILNTGSLQECVYYSGNSLGYSLLVCDAV